MSDDQKLAAEYEEFVAQFVKELWSAKEPHAHNSAGHFHFHDVEPQVQKKLKRRNGESIKFDVVVEAKVPGRRWLFILECKHLNQAVEVGKVDEFSKKLDELEGLSQAVIPIMVTKVGYQKGALKQAKALGIGLWVLRKRKDGEVCYKVIQESVQLEPTVDAHVCTYGRLEVSNRTYDFDSPLEFLKVMTWLARSESPRDRRMQRESKEALSVAKSNTPKTIYPKIQELCRRLAKSQSPGFVPVSPAEGSKEQECFEVVDRHVTANGGSQVLGWQIWEWPGVYLEAEFHAVWRAPDGTLLDLTPKDVPTTSILFLPDPARSYDGRRIKNEMLPLSDHVSVAQFIKACDDHARFMNSGNRARMDKIELIGSEVDVYQGIVSRRTAALARIDSLPEPSGRHQCWCGSGKKLRSCHMVGNG